MARPPSSLEATFRPEGDAARLARIAVEEALAGAGVAKVVVHDALLVLSELVSNAMRHARTEFIVAVTVEGGTLRIEVFDCDTGPPVLRGLSSESTCGRGLQVVDGLARRWGWHPRRSKDGAPGKVVWAELALDQGSASFSGST